MQSNDTDKTTSSHVAYLRLAMQSLLSECTIDKILSSSKNASWAHKVVKKSATTMEYLLRACRLGQATRIKNS